MRLRPEERQGEAARHPLSWNQSSLWYLHALDPASPAYHVGGAMRLRGDLDISAFARAVQRVSDRHDALRTTFTTVDGRPFQLVHPRMDTPVLEVDATELDEAALRERVQHDYEQPIDLRSGPGLHMVIYHNGPAPVLLVRIHHALMDLWSLALVFFELGELYSAELEGRPATLEPPGAQYPEFARWQREFLDSEAGQQQGRYWEEQLRGMPPVLDLPLDRTRPPLQSLRGRGLQFALDPELTKALRRLARQEGATTFTLLLAAFQALLFRYTGQEDFGIGAPAAGRGQARFRDMVGHCVNMIVLRARFAGDPSFRELLVQARRTLQDAMKNEDFPFSQVVARLGVPADQSRTPLFQTSLVFQQSPLLDMTSLVFNVPSDRPVEIGNVIADPFPMEAQQGQFDLSLWSARIGRSLHGEFKYDSALFDAATAERLAGHFQLLLRRLVDDPDAPVSQLPLTDAAERTRVVEEWNDTARPYRRDACLHELFEEQAGRTPGAVAVESADRALTYGEVEQRANRLAHHLRSLGVGSGALVAVLVDRSPDAVVALLGILKAGAGYVPLEAHYPPARIRFILESLAIQVAVTQSGLVPQLDVDLAHLVCLDGADGGPGARGAGTRVWTWGAVSEHPVSRPEGGASADDVAYVIFTSGSTGTPKGVRVRHRPVINLIEWVNRTYQVEAGDRLLFITSLSFDLSVYDVFGSLAAGATIRIAAREEVQDARRLTTILCEDGITIWDSAPPALHQLVPFLPASAPSSRLRLVLLSGDWIPVKLPDQIRSVFPRAHVVSLGGATEATIWSNWYDVGEVDPAWASIPYGRPIQNARYYILDRAGNPCPVGLPGDLYIGGECLADGYVNDPELTAAKFVPDPFDPTPGARMYDTGDRARFFPDGIIQFLGRRDFQVKIRGYRIELGEIESVLAEHPGVRECAVVARDDGGGGERYLVAYVVANADGAPPTADLRAHLRERLPEFMVPHHFVALERLPLTPNGKLDRAALPAPERRREDVRAEYVAPANEREQVLAEIWQAVLGIDLVGATDNFFDLGGHSLLAVQVVYEIEQRTGVALPVTVLLRAPTVRELAARLDDGTDAHERTSLVVHLREGEQRPPLFLLHPSGGEVVAYRALLGDLDPGRPLIGIRSPSRSGGTDPGSIDELAKRYSEAVMAAEPHGPYLLAGWSLGGVLAHAVTSHLERAGESVSLCVLIDSQLPAERHELLDRVMFRLGASLGPLAGSLAHQPERTLAALLDLGDEERLEEALRLADAQRDAAAALPADVLAREITITRRHSEMLAEHRAGVVDAPLHVVWAEHSLHDGRALTDWAAHTRGGLQEHVVPGANHYDLFAPPHLPTLCRHLNAALELLRDRVG